MPSPRYDVTHRPRLIPLMLCLGLLGACESMPDAAPETGSAVAPLMPVPPKSEQKPDPAFIVHEWGTFTSMQSSSGQTLGGMYEEDEPLPTFVHRFQISADRPMQKGIPMGPPSYDMLRRATQRLETPVLYFYGEGAPPRVSVQVDFPEGIISEWYPAAATSSPSPREITVISHGSMTWEAELLTSPARVVPVPEDDIWAPSRRVDALTVKVGEEEEPLIFYRGVGTFTLPITIKSLETGTLQITNESDVTIPQAFLYKNLHGRQAIYPVGELKANGKIEHGGIFASPSPKEGPIGSHSMEELKAPLITALTDAGLYPREARAMVDTWERSYFQTPGVRLLYIVPDVWTTKLLPLTISPQPDELVRVLIGRIEVRSTAQEDAFEATLRAHFKQGTTPTSSELGPFLMPRLQHLMSLPGEDSDHDFATWLETLTFNHHRGVPVLETQRAPEPAR